MLDVIPVCVGPFEVNCYIAVAAGRNALVVDPGADERAIIGVIGKNKLNIRAYLLTHGHVDHISALNALWELIPAPVAIHAADEKWAFGAANQLPPYYSSVPLRPKIIGRVLRGGEKWDEGGFRYEVIATPGHSPGGVCFYFPDDNILFSGDTLFQDTIGRTDISGGDSVVLNKSLKVLAGLPPQTKVYPGHGAETTIGRELESNPFLKSL